jgi:hypothetical protein
MRSEKKRQIVCSFLLKEEERKRETESHKTRKRNRSNCLKREKGRNAIDWSSRREEEIVSGNISRHYLVCFSFSLSLSLFTNQIQEGDKLENSSVSRETSTEQLGSDS